MPSLQVVNTTRDKPEPTGVQNFFSKLQKHYKEQQDNDTIGNLISEYQQNREQANSWEDLQLNLQKSNISPSKRLEAQQELNATRKNIIEKDKALNARMGKKLLSEEERAAEIQRLVDDGYPIEEAEIYVDQPPGVKQSLERNHRMERARKERLSKSEIAAMEVDKAMPEKVQPPIGEVSESIPSQEMVDLTKEQPKKEWDDLPKPPNMTTGERIKWENNNEKTNIKKLEEVETKKKGYKTNQGLIKSMTGLNESKKLPSGLGKMIQLNWETGDIDTKAQFLGLVNPETELYVKNLKQFLKGAKDFFGARVTNFDVTSFMQQLPSLLNSEQGRRLILKQMELVNDLESVHANEMDKGIKHYGRNANYIDISRTVDEKVSSKENKLLGKIDNVVEASTFIDKMAKNPKLFKDTVLMEKNGEFRAVKKEDVEKAKAKEWSEY